MTPETLLLERNDWVPNNPRLPVLLYRGVLPLATPEEMASGFERLFQGNGWPPLWRNGVHGFHHYHPAAHEVLGLCGRLGALAVGWTGRSRGASGRGRCRIAACRDRPLPDRGQRRLSCRRRLSTPTGYPYSPQCPNNRNHPNDRRNRFSRVGPGRRRWRIH